MDRTIGWIFIAAIATLVVGLLLATTPIGVALVLTSAGILGGLAVVTAIRAQRNPGATWDVNPRAARRAAAADRKAAERKPADRAKDRDAGG